MGAPVELTELCRVEYPRLVRALTLWCGDRCLAEDLAQEAMVKAVVHWRRVRAMQSPGGWLFQVARNQAMSAHRRRGAELRAIDRLPAPPTTGDGEERATDDVLLLREVLAGLPETQRSALVLRHYLDLSVADAAVALGVSGDALRQLCHRGIESLRTRLDVDVTEQEARYA